MLKEFLSRIVGTCASSYRALIGRALKVGGPVSGVIATMGDLGAPLAAFALLLTIFCTVTTLVAGFMWFGRYQKSMRAALADGRITQEEIAHATESNGWSITFAFGLVATCMLALVLAAQAAVKEPDGGPERGVIATVVPSLRKIQDSLFNIEGQVAEINAATQATHASTRRIEKQTTGLAATAEETKADTTVLREQTAQVVQKLDDLSRIFEEVSKRDGIIPNPQTPAEHYHNARFSEVKADFATARKSYNAFLGSGVECIDPYLAFTDMLKVQDGMDGAREVVTALRKSNQTLSLEAASALLLSKPQRLAALEALAERAPDFAPAAYLASREFSAEKLGEQTIADKNEEKKWLDRFRALNDAGQFQKYILDKREGKKWLDDVDARAAKLAAMPAAVLKNPVTLTAMQSNDGWMLTLGFADYKIKKIEYRFDGKGDFKDSGVSTIMNSQTGLPMPNLSIGVGKVPAGDHHVEVRYVDMADQLNGPFTVSFNTASAALAFGKQVLNQLIGSWVSLREFNGQSLCYFTTLLSYRNSLKSIRYSLDSEALDKTFPFKPVKEGQSPFEVGDGTLYLTLPKKVQSVTVQLEFTDGTLSEVKTFAKE